MIWFKINFDSMLKWTHESWETEKKEKHHDQLIKPKFNSGNLIYRFCNVRRNNTSIFSIYSSSAPFTIYSHRSSFTGVTWIPCIILKNDKIENGNVTLMANFGIWIHAFFYECNVTLYLWYTHTKLCITHMNMSYIQRQVIGSIEVTQIYRVVHTHTHTQICIKCQQNGLHSPTSYQQPDEIIHQLANWHIKVSMQERSSGEWS